MRKPFRFVCIILVKCHHETGDTAHWPPLVFVICVRVLFPLLHLPTHLIAVTTSRTASELYDFYLCPLVEHIRIGTPQVTSGEGGSVTLPYFRLVT